MLKLSLQTKKRLTTVTQSIFFLLGGIEYAVVLPTLNLYLQTLDQNAIFFGIVMSAFSLTGVLMAPLFGLFQDKYHATKILILFGNLWEIGGNFLYLVGGSGYVLLGSRLICGVGASVGGAIFAQISLTSTEKERASAFVTASASRQIGLVIGPAFNLVLDKMDFYIGPFHVNKFSGPGFLMFCLFIIFEFVTLLCYYDIPSLPEQAQLAGGKGRLLQEAADRVAEGPDSNTIINAEQVPIANGVKLVSGQPVVEHSDEETSSQSSYNETDVVEVKPAISKINVLLREEVVVLLALQFVFMFNQTCLETAVTVMTEYLLYFNGVANSILFCIAGVELLLSFIVIKFISKYVSDRTMLVSSLTLEILPYILLLIFYPNATPGRDKNLWWFITLFIIQVAGLAFLIISIVSLFSKVTPPGIQGFTQGIRRSLGGLGTILGPLWAGSMEQLPFETLSVMMALFILTLGMVLLSWKRLRPHSEIARDMEQRRADDDMRPLLDPEDTDYGVA